MNVNRDTVPIGQLFAEPGDRTFQADAFQLRRVKPVRQRLNVARKIDNLLVGFSNFAPEIGR